MQTVLLHIEELENENMKKNLYFGVKNTKNLFYVRNSIHVLFRNIFHPKNESMLTVSYYQHIMGVWRDWNMDLKHNQITMRELLRNKQAYLLLYKEFPMFMTPQTAYTAANYPNGSSVYFQTKIKYVIRAVGKYLNDS